MVTLGPKYSDLKVESLSIQRWQKGICLHAIAAQLECPVEKASQVTPEPSQSTVIGQLPGVWVQGLMACKTRVCCCWLDGQPSKGLI